MVLIQTWNFFLLMFLGNIGKKNVFYHILGQKKRLTRLKKQEV